MSTDCKTRGGRGGFFFLFTCCFWKCCPASVSSQRWQLISGPAGSGSRFLTLPYHGAPSEIPAPVELDPFFSHLTPTSMGFPNRAPETPARLEHPPLSPSFMQSFLKALGSNTPDTSLCPSKGTVLGRGFFWQLHVTVVFLLCLFILPRAV